MSKKQPEYMKYWPKESRVNDISQQLKSIRKLFGISQKTLARTIKVSDNTIRKFENEAGDINVNLVVKIMGELSKHTPDNSKLEWLVDRSL